MHNGFQHLCFDAEAYITLFDYTIKQVKDLIKGDELLSLDGNKATILCVIKTQIDHSIELCNIHGLLITPWHPIRINKNIKWYFPYDVVQSSLIYIDYIYNLVLDNHHTVFINDVEVVTLGHNFKEDVVAHPYFGSKQIIKDLKKIPGFDEGLILNLKTIYRSGSYNLVTKVGL